MPIDWIYALLGGILIGIAVSLMLYWNGRVTGISGIINSAFTAARTEAGWRLAFLAGLLTGGLLLKLFQPEVFSGQLNTPVWSIVLAGLLVGFGSTLGSGCTSGHGVCGISRLSIRSILATVTFILAGMAAVYAFRQLGVLV